MHTETEAQEKWCPEVRAVLFTTRDQVIPATGNVIGQTVDGMGAERAHCIASACMHWRWAQKRNPEWTPGMSASYPYDPRTEKPMHIEDRTKGFCGLSGRP